MPLNFNLDFAGPKIDIVTREVPIAAIEKVGDVLQDRYDKSLEQYNLFQELAKQAEQVADPAEKQKVRDYVTSLEPQIKSISERGDFHNMRHQTAALARNAANNLKNFEERAKTISNLRQQINVNEKLGKQEVKDYYIGQLNNILNKTSYDPQRGVFNFAPIEAPQITPDVDVNEPLRIFGTGYLADKAGTEAGNIRFINPGETLPNGAINQTGLPMAFNVKTGKVIEQVKYDEVARGMKNVLDSNIGVQAMIDRDTQIFLKNNPNVDPNVAKQKIKEDTYRNAIDAWANKAAYKSEVRSSDANYDAGLSGAISAGYVPPFSSDFRFIGVPSEVDISKSLDEINKERISKASTLFDNKTGAFKSSNESRYTYDQALAQIKKLQPNLEGPGLDQAVINLMKNNPLTNLDYLIPKGYQQRVRSTNKNLTDKEVYDRYMMEKADNSRLLLTKYVLADKGLRETVDANMKPLISNLPLGKVVNGEFIPASQTEVDEALKGNMHFVPATGQITVGSGNNELVTALGAQGKSVNANVYQARMGQLSQILKAAMNPDVFFETTAPQFQIGNSYYRIIKGTGVPFRKEDGKMGYATDQIQKVNSRGDVEETFSLTNEGLNQFVNRGLTDVAVEFSRK